MKLFWILWLVIALIHFLKIGVRPIHHDEAVNGWFLDRMAESGAYFYDPKNYHGPLFFYLLKGWEWIAGRSIEAFRVFIVFAVMAMSFFSLRFGRYFPDIAVRVFSMSLLVSPAFVFYSRYVIHEIFFSFASLWVFERWWILRQEKRVTRNSILFFGLSVGIAASLKETFIIILIALGCAEIALRILGRSSFSEIKTRGIFQIQNIAIGLGAFFLPVLLFFSGFGVNPNGVSAFFEAFFFWGQTGQNGNGHEKWFGYWLELLVQYEWIALFSFVTLMLMAHRKMTEAQRLLTWFGMAMGMGYSLIPYKTPWCVLSFLPFLLLSGTQVIALTQGKWKILVSGMLFVSFAHDGWRAYQLSWDRVDSDEEPYVYAQTYRGYLERLQKIADHAKSEPTWYEEVRVVLCTDASWPLPFVFGRFKSVGSHTLENLPQVLDHEVMVFDEKHLPIVEPKIQVSEYETYTTRTRQWGSPVKVFIKKKYAL